MELKSFKFYSVVLLFYQLDMAGGVEVCCLCLPVCLSLSIELLQHHIPSASHLSSSSSSFTFLLFSLSRSSLPSFSPPLSLFSSTLSSSFSPCFSSSFSVFLFYFFRFFKYLSSKSNTSKQTNVSGLPLIIIVLGKWLSSLRKAEGLQNREKLGFLS